MIGDDGACSLAAALSHNSTLKVLSLSQNIIGEARDAAFRAALQNNLTLAKLAGVAGVEDILARNRAILFERNQRVRRCLP